MRQILLPILHSCRLALLSAIFLCSIAGGSQALASSEDHILVGATVSRSGRFQETSRMIEYGYTMWASQVNANGGLLGREVKLLLYDDKSSPELAATYYQRLIEEDGAELLLSPYGTPITLAVSEVTEQHRKVLLACASAASAPWERGYKYLFGIYALADRYFISLLDIMARNNLRTAVIIYEDSVFNKAVATAANDWAGRFGIEVMQIRSFKKAQEELPGIVAELKALRPDGVVFTAYPTDSYAFLSILEKAKFKPKALGMTIVPTYPDFYQKVGPFAENIFGVSQWEPDKRIPFPGTSQFIQDFKEFTGFEPSYHAGSAYAECQILQQAIEKAGKIDHEQIRDHIYAMDSMTVIGRFKVDHTGRQIGHNPLLIQWQNGKKEIVHPPKMRTKLPIFPSTGE